MRFILLCLLSVASAEECLSWPQMVDYLNGYGQIPSQVGLTESSNTMTVFVNPEMDTWTIVHRTPLGCTTIWDQGIGWRWLFREREAG